jgi:HTH-type transcriptional regulator/antitoxin HigA
MDIVMQVPKIIRTQEEHRSAVQEIERLMDLPETEENRERLELLSLIVEDFEKKQFPISRPDPVDAILFRMEQQNLSHRDLVPFIGSRGRVSEILARKRPLTLAMIRALSDGLGIPAQVLIQDQTELEFEEAEAVRDWTKFPGAEMLRRGWITSISQIHDFFGKLEPRAQTALYRRSKHIRSAREMDRYALLAWTARVISIGEKAPIRGPFNPEAIGFETMRLLAKESSREHGPLRAQDFLSELGIACVVEPHLPKTLVDGAAILFLSERPIIGLSLRHDRMDNFWFTLMHELAHVALHWGGEIAEFIDDLDVETNDFKEREADDLAGEALIPKKIWSTSPARQLKSPAAALHLAREAQVHPAIAAGRMRHHWNSFRILSHLVGGGEVRKEFTNIGWPE